MNKKVLGIFLALVLAASASACTSGTDEVSSLDSSAEQTSSVVSEGSDSTSDSTAVTDSDSAEAVSLDYQLNEDGSVSMSYGAILHAWCWSFNTITENLQNIKDAGYTSIQTSPINQCKVGDDGGLSLYSENNGKWYYHYQPTDYVIGNYQLGTLDEFKTMCAEAKKLGLKIIVDAPLNHVSSDVSVVSENIFNLCDEPFHDRGEIATYSSRKQVTQNDLLGLKDLRTQAPEIQQYLLNYLKSCVEAGASGFRFDAAKHIELPTDDEEYASDFWEVILDNGCEFQYGEILQGECDEIADYAQLMSVTASSYGESVRKAVNGNLSTALVEPYCAANVDPSKFVTWVESHDNYCNDGSWEQMEESDVEFGWAIIASRSGGAPLFFSRPNGASIDSQWGNNVIGAVGSDGYKSENVSALNHFRNEMAGLGENLTNPDTDNNVLMIERGDKGAVIINKGTSDFTLDGTVSVLADGVYKDKVSGAEFTVANGTISGTVPSESIIVIY